LNFVLAPLIKWCLRFAYCLSRSVSQIYTFYTRNRYYASVWLTSWTVIRSTHERTTSCVVSSINEKLIFCVRRKYSHKLAGVFRRRIRCGQNQKQSSRTTRACKGSVKDFLTWYPFRYFVSEIKSRSRQSGEKFEDRMITDHKKTFAQPEIMICAKKEMKLLHRRNFWSIFLISYILQVMNFRCRYYWPE